MVPSGTALLRPAGPNLGLAAPCQFVVAADASRRTPKEEACGRTVGRDVAARVRRIVWSMSVARRWWEERAGEEEEEDGSTLAPVNYDKHRGEEDGGVAAAAEGILVFSCAVAIV